VPDIIPLRDASTVVGLPDPADSRREARASVAEQARLAAETRDLHWRGLRSRRHRDLTAEKYLLHVDGEGFSQWLDVFRGTKLRVSPNLSGVPRTQNNQMRPILDNFVAHLTTQPFQFVVEPKLDRKAKTSAIVDQAIINADVRRMNWNALWAEAKYMAACAGFCPVHAMCRQERTHPYEGVLAQHPDQAQQDAGQQPQQGGPGPITIDGWVGNPFDTFFNSGARLNSLHRATYGRVLPADLVRRTFGREDVYDNDRLPSASTYQRIVQRWAFVGGFVHGTGGMSLGWGHEELIGLIYDEVLPGTHPDYPDGMLRIICLNGLAATQREDARGGLGEPILLWEGPLPGKRFSFVNVYSHHRFDDIHGKPYVADIDDDQIELNQLESLSDDFIRRATRPPLASSGGVNVETAGYMGDTILETTPSLHGGQVELRYLEYPARHMQFLANKIERVADGMYRKAGWQASSRGETAGESGKAIIALQQADDSIFGPITQRTREEVEAYCDLVWRLRKDYMDVPMVLDNVGAELAHHAAGYVDRTMMSERPPVFTLVSAFGTSTEAKAQQLLNMYGMVDAKGEQLIGTRELRKLWPDNSLFVDSDDPQEVRERRPTVVNELIRQEAKKVTEQFRQNYQQWQPSMADRHTAMMGEYVAMVIDSMEPSMMDDDLLANIETLSIITQEPTEDPVARRAAMVRQGQYWQWLAEQQAARSRPPEDTENGGESRSRSGAPSTAAAFDPAQPGTASAASMIQADRNFEEQIA